MKRFLSVLLAFLTLCAVCAIGASAAKGFDPDDVQYAMLLNDIHPVDGKGHCTTVLVDGSGNSRLYTFQQKGLWKQSNTAKQTEQMLQDGKIPVAPSQFRFDRIIKYKIKPEEGRRMYDCAETSEFGEFHKNASFYKPIGFMRQYDNCVTVAQKIAAAGSRKYKFYYPFGVPNYAFTAMKWRLAFRGVDYEIFYPVVLDEPTTTQAAAQAPA